MNMRAWLPSLLLGLVALVACSETDSSSMFSAQAVADGGEARPGPEGSMCCTMACGPVFDTSFRISVDDATLQASTISVCRNGTCFETSFSDVTLPTGVSTGQAKRFVSDLDRETSKAPLIEAIVSGGTPRSISVHYTPWAGNDWSDGDRYEVVLKDARGTVLHRAEGALTYTRRAGCCGATCGNATFDEPDGGADAGDAGDGGS